MRGCDLLNVHRTSLTLFHYCQTTFFYFCIWGRFGECVKMYREQYSPKTRFCCLSRPQDTFLHPPLHHVFQQSDRFLSSWLNWWKKAEADRVKENPLQKGPTVISWDTGIPSQFFLVLHFRPKKYNACLPLINHDSICLETERYLAASESRKWANCALKWLNVVLEGELRKTCPCC